MYSSRTASGFTLVPIATRKHHLSHSRTLTIIHEKSTDNNHILEVVDSETLKEESDRIQHEKLAQLSTNGALIEEDDGPRKLPGAILITNALSQPLAEVTEAGLVILSTALVAVDTLQNLPPSLCHIVVTSENVITYVFLVRFFLKWYCSAEETAQHFTKPFVLLDLAVIVLPLILPALSSEPMLPDWLSSPGGLITLRLLRILRLQRPLADIEKFRSFQRSLGFSNPSAVKPYQLQLARVVLSLFTLLSVAAGLIYTTEHEVNPEIPDYFTALYFGLTTLTTVGFGDITPVTSGGKLVVSGSILVGVAVIPGQAAALFEALLDYDRQRNMPDAANSAKKVVSGPPTPPRAAGMMDVSIVCNTCGATMHWVDASYCWSCGGNLDTEGNLLDA